MYVDVFFLNPKLEGDPTFYEGSKYTVEDFIAVVWVIVYSLNPKPQVASPFLQDQSTQLKPFPVV